MPDISTKDLLLELNELREEAGMKPLTAWKSSRIKLEEAIDKLDASEKPITPKSAAKQKPTKKKPDVKQKTEGKKRGPQPKDDGMLSVSDIARELGIDPKVARAKLRRYGEEATDGRWARVKPDSPLHKKLIETMQKGTRAAVSEDIE